MPSREIAAIVLAAGFSNRMGRLKPLLPLGEGTVIEKTIRSFQDAGVVEIITVIGHRYTEILPVLEKSGLAWVVNRQYGEGMLKSIKTGVGKIGPAVKAFFMMPADIPLVRASTLIDMIQIHKMHPEKVIYPLFDGQRGHPPLIPALHRETILKWKGAGGLRRCLEIWKRESIEVETADSGVLMDMDTLNDYECILEKYRNRAIPSREEAMVILRKQQPGHWSLHRHSKAVAAIAVKIGKALNRNGISVDIAQLDAAGLLHDVAKGEDEHAEAGAGLITENGFPIVADIVRTHMDFTEKHDGEIHEKEIIYLADKMVSGAEIVSLEKRLGQKKMLLADDSEALKMAALRMEKALQIQRSIEAVIGKPLEELILKR